MSNAAIYFVDRHVAEGRADKTAFREAETGRSLSYGDLAAHSDQAIDHPDPKTGGQRDEIRLPGHKEVSLFKRVDQMRRSPRF